MSLRARKPGTSPRSVRWQGQDAGNEYACIGKCERVRRGISVPGQKSLSNR